MIGRLVGKIVEEGADGTIVLDVGGVGYELTVPLGAVGRATAVCARGLRPAAPGSAPEPPGGTLGELTLFVHTHVREDAFLLYGFSSRDERAVFRQLIGISSIGPKIALNILGALSVGELAAAIAGAETKRLTAVPGVGKKTAERIVLELKDKLLVQAPSALPGTAAPPGRAAARGANADLLHGALTRMGYRPAEADRAVTALGARVETEPLADLVREALGVLAP